VINVEAISSISKGFVEESYESLIPIFSQGIDDPEKSGAAFSVWKDGQEIVSVFAGTADVRSGRQWDDTTQSILFSSSKGLASLVIARIAARGELDLLAPIGSIWPEFMVGGKGKIALADVLAHRAGVSAPEKNMTLKQVLDLESWTAQIASQEPLWEPGAGHAYHALTWGPIAQEIVKRATGRELHDLFSDEIAKPLNAKVSLKADGGDLAALAFLTTSKSWLSTASRGDERSPVNRALSLGGALPSRLVEGNQGFNDPLVQAGNLVAAGGIGTASGLARIWSSTVVETLGVRLLNEESIRILSEPRSEGPWIFSEVAPPFHRWGAGVQLSSEVTPWLSSASFGHDGAGGQTGMADAQNRVGIGYIRNQLDGKDAVAPLINELKSLFSR
jgi:CubicO group peptidase (beta-lactamase class C family)